jgi:hypothetical protein
MRAADIRRRVLVQNKAAGYRQHSTQCREDSLDATNALVGVPYAALNEEETAAAESPPFWRRW